MVEDNARARMRAELQQGGDAPQSSDSPPSSTAAAVLSPRRKRPAALCATDRSLHAVPVRAGGGCR
jgi:hypothetical protein